MYDIESLYEATSVDDACRALAEDPKAIVIAGGTDVLVKVRGGKLAGAHLVSIHGLNDELDGVRLADDGTVEIGPITWFHHVTTSPVIQTTVPTLGEACDTPGGPQLRVSGTIGGNVCNAATSADTASTLFAYGALLDVRSVRGERTIPIEQWYAGPGRSTKERDEVLVRIRIPRDHYEGFTGHYFKYGKRRALEIATMGCCCLVKLGADKSTIDDIRLAFGVAAPTPMRATNAQRTPCAGCPCQRGSREDWGARAGRDAPARLLARLEGLPRAAHQRDVQALACGGGAQGRG
jgi:xanthine dehydrogenase FAD-binding subunit